MKIKRGIVIASAIVIAGWCLCAYEIAGSNSRRIQNNYFLQSLAVQIESYREDLGYYPRSLSEMLLDRNMTEGWRLSVQNVLSDVQSNRWHDIYSYEPSTNGFTIIITGPALGPAGWFGAQRRMKRTYYIGEAFDINSNSRN